MKIVFKPNSICYGQDFSFKRGIPTDVVFEEKTNTLFRDERDIWLFAPGYGKKPYGNGAIVLRRKELYKHREYFIVIEGDLKNENQTT